MESAIKEDLVLKKQLESDLKQQSGGQKSGSCPLCVIGELARVWCVRAELCCITFVVFAIYCFQIVFHATAQFAFCARKTVFDVSRNAKPMRECW